MKIGSISLSHPTFLIVILISLAWIRGAIAFQCYPVNRPLVKNKGAPLYPLDTDGLSGRYTGYWSNTTDIEYGEITFQLWFLSYDAREFFLSMIAIRNPAQLWDLYRPFIYWTANSNQLVTENATLAFGSDGNLKLQDFGRVVWSTNTTGKGVSSLCISNLGNIYLTNSSEDIIWMSFDTPTNIFPIQVGMKPEIRLISWESDKNPRPGAYSLVMETTRLAIYRYSEPYWALESPENSRDDDIFAAFCWQPSGIISVDLHNNRSMFDSQQNFISGESCASSRPLRRLKLVDNAANFTYGIFAKLTSTGDLVIFTWNTSSNYWYEAYKLSSNFSCFLPGQCGSYGICSTNTGQCTQDCPETFRYSNGGTCEATRQAPLADSCIASGNHQEEFDLVNMQDMDYFSSNLSSTLLDAATEEDCRSKCHINCRCRAAFFRPGSCFHTYEDVQTLKTGTYNVSLKIPRLSQAEINSRKNRQHFLRVALPILVPSLVVLILILAWILHVRRSRSRELNDEDLDEERDEAELESSLRNCMLERYTYKQLEKITSGFTTCLGHGGYGSVYKGVLENGLEVAVKRLQGSNQTSRDFYSEIASLARTHHLNLVRFMGFCAGGPKKHCWRKFLIF